MATTFKQFREISATRPKFTRDEAGVCVSLTYAAQPVTYSDTHAGKQREIKGIGRDEAAALADLFLKMRGLNMHTIAGSFNCPYFVGHDTTTVPIEELPCDIIMGNRVIEWKHHLWRVVSVDHSAGTVTIEMVD